MVNETHKDHFSNLCFSTPDYISRLLITSIWCPKRIKESVPQMELVFHPQIYFPFLIWWQSHPSFHARNWRVTLDPSFHMPLIWASLRLAYSTSDSFIINPLPPNLHSCGHNSVLCHLSLDYSKTFWLACLSSLREVQPPVRHWRYPSIKMQVWPTHSSENHCQGGQWSLWCSSVLPASNLHPFLTQGD